MSVQQSPGRTIMLVAGEPSGDVLGARLMRALRDRSGGTVRFVGVGGDEMAREGLQSLFPITILSVMGLFEVLPRALAIRRRLKQTEALVRQAQPDCLITIDSPGFNRRLVQAVQDMDLLKIHYVAPSVWAYKPKRAVRMAQLYDHLLTLLPFEPPLFEHEGLSSSFVGHPAIEAERNYSGDPRAFRSNLGIPSHAPVAAVLFGSRMGELRRMGPIFIDGLRQAVSQIPNLVVVAPTLPHLKPAVERMLADLKAPARVVGPDLKMDAFHAADVALAASGTVALELSLAGTPSVVAYRLNGLTAAIAKRLIRIRWASLTNILLDREVVPELIQERCRADQIAPHIVALLRDSTHRDAQAEAGRLVADMLRPPGEWPSEKAARVVLNLTDRN